MENKISNIFLAIDVIQDHYSCSLFLGVRIFMLFNGELIESFKVHSITKAIFGKSEHALLAMESRRRGPVVSG